MSANDDQRPPTRIAAISALLVVSAFVAGKAGRDAILLSRFSIESLPLFIGLSAALSLPVILLTGKLMIRFGPARLIPVMNAVSGVMAIGEWALLGSYPRPITVLVFFHLSTASAVLVSGFWSIVNERFDIQSAKRHIGRIGLGATLGGILGGVIAERSAVYFERDAILLVLATLQLTCAAALFLFGRGAAPRPVDTTAAEARPGMWSSLVVVTRSNLLRTVGCVVVLSAVAAGIMDYVFKADIAGGASKDSLLRSLAVFYTVTNVITAVVQIAVCGPIISRLGVPRSVATLPATVTGFGILAAAIPLPICSAIARGAELVTRNSVYRAGYELLYAPLPEEHKRPTKVVLDVGADKIGDIIGAQVVGLILYFAIDDRTSLLIGALVVGVLTLWFALRLPKAYTKALEESLMTYAADATTTEEPLVAQPEPWLVLSGVPSFGDAGDVVPLRLRKRAPRTRAAAPPPPSRPDPVVNALHPTPHHNQDAISERVRDLRSGDTALIRRGLARPLPLELVSHALDLIGSDDVARDAGMAVAELAPRCTGLLVDALLDQTRDPTLRRRLPAIMSHGDPELAAWGLWRGLADPSFEVRYRCGTALARLVAEGRVKDIHPEDVFETVRRELGGDATEWRTRKVARDLAADDEQVDSQGESALEHVFRVLGLVLPAEPLRIALHALQADDASLRGMALEYLESILPPDVRAQLWPLLDRPDSGAASAVSAGFAPVGDELPATEPTAPPQRRSQDELAAELKLHYPTILERLKHRISSG